MIFQNKKIVIAGGTSGIGLAAALRFKKEDAQVIVTGRNKQKVDAASAEGLQATVLDSADRAALDQFFSAAGRIDHLVVSISGGKGMGAFKDLSLSVLRDAFAEKFFPQLETVQAALPYLNDGGSVTLITAISSVARMPGTSGIGAVNGALELMIPVWAKEMKRLRFNAVSPGLVDTPWWDFLPASEKPAAFARYTADIPAARVARPEEIADAIVFVVGNEYMTGKVIGIDGGLS